MFRNSFIICALTGGQGEDSFSAGRGTSRNQTSSPNLPSSIQHRSPGVSASTSHSSVPIAELQQRNIVSLDSTGFQTPIVSQTESQFRLDSNNTNAIFGRDLDTDGLALIKRLEKKIDRLQSTKVEKADFFELKSSITNLNSTAERIQALLDTATHGSSLRQSVETLTSAAQLNSVDLGSSSVNQGKYTTLTTHVTNVSLNLKEEMQTYIDERMLQLGQLLGELTISESEVVPVLSNTNQGSLNTNQGELNTNQGSLNTNQGELNTNQDSLNTNQGSLNTNQGEFNTDQGLLNTNQGEFNTDQGSLNTNQGVSEMVPVLSNTNQGVLNGNQPKYLSNCFVAEFGYEFSNGVKVSVDVMQFAQSSLGNSNKYIYLGYNSCEKPMYHYKGYDFSSTHGFYGSLGLRLTAEHASKIIRNSLSGGNSHVSGDYLAFEKNFLGSLVLSPEKINIGSNSIPLLVKWKPVPNSYRVQETKAVPLGKKSSLTSGRNLYESYFDLLVLQKNKLSSQEFEIYKTTAKASVEISNKQEVPLNQVGLSNVSEKQQVFDVKFTLIPQKNEYIQSVSRCSGSKSYMLIDPVSTVSRPKENNILDFSLLGGGLAIGIGCWFASAFLLKSPKIKSWFEKFFNIPNQDISSSNGPNTKSINSEKPVSNLDTKVNDNV